MKSLLEVLWERREGLKKSGKKWSLMDVRMKSLLEVLWERRGGLKKSGKNGHLWMAPMPIEQSQHRCWEKVNKYSTFHSGRLRFAFLARKFYSKSHANFGDRPMGNQRKICTLCFLSVFIYLFVISSLT